MLPTTIVLNTEAVQKFETIPEISRRGLPLLLSPLQLCETVVPFQFRYASCLDIFLLVLGVLFAIIHGAGWPLLAIVFGHMTNAFIHQKQAGFWEWEVNATGSPGTMDESAMREGGVESIFDPVSIIEYNNTMNTFALSYVIIAAIVFIASFVHVSLLPFARC